MESDYYTAALRRLCENTRGGHKAVGEAVGANGQTIYQICKGVKLPSGNPRSVGLDLRRRITAAFPGWLDNQPATAAASQGVTIRQFDTGGAMGSGVVLKDQPGVIQSWTVNDEWARQNVRGCTSLANLCIVTGFGDSMRGMFNPGDPLICDRGVRTVEFDGVYFFRVENEGFIKRLQRVPGEGILALSENTAYRTWTIKPTMDFEVFGRILKAWVSEDF